MGPGTTCWPGGVLKCSPGVGGSKMASRGVELLLTPPTPTYADTADHFITLTSGSIRVKGTRGQACRVAEQNPESPENSVLF